MANKPETQMVLNLMIASTSVFKKNSPTDGERSLLSAKIVLWLWVCKYSYCIHNTAHQEILSKLNDTVKFKNRLV